MFIYESLNPYGHCGICGLSSHYPHRENGDRHDETSRLVHFGYSQVWANGGFGAPAVSREVVPDYDRYGQWPPRCRACGRTLQHADHYPR